MLNERQRRFVELYRAGGGDAAGAAARAGYSPRGARRQARTLLEKPEVAAALAADEAVSQEKIVRELAHIAFGAGEVRDGDKLRALEMLTKLLPAPADGADDAPATGVVILPEVMPGPALPKDP